MWEAMANSAKIEVARVARVITLSSADRRIVADNEAKEIIETVLVGTDNDGDWSAVKTTGERVIVMTSAPASLDGAGTILIEENTMRRRLVAIPKAVSLATLAAYVAGGFVHNTPVAAWRTVDEVTPGRYQASTDEKIKRKWAN